MFNYDKILDYSTNTNINITKDNTLYYTNKINALIADTLLHIFDFEFSPNFDKPMWNIIKNYITCTYFISYLL